MRNRSFVLLTIVLAAIPVSAQFRTSAPLQSNHGVVPEGGGAAITYDDVLGDLLASPAIAMRSCVVGGTTAQCLFVKKFLNAGCTTATLDYGPDDNPCVRATSKTDSRFCMVTDELSQVGLALSMTKRADGRAAFRAWVNAVRAVLASEPRLPLWRVGVDTTATVAVIDHAPAGGDDASDATARIITALFIAAANDFFEDAERRDFQLLGDTISRAFLGDFVKTTFTGTVAGVPGVTINYWLASGVKTGRRSTPFENNGAFTFGGYFGDVTAALTAAFFGGIGQQSQYQERAVDTVNNYLLASKYDGVNFRVPPMKFRWESTGESVCFENCPILCNGEVSWDDADAPRAISICRARYQAEVGGLPLPAVLDGYCDRWIPAGFLRQTAPFHYAIRYALSGARCDPGADYKASGLGASMFFRYGDLVDFGHYIDQAFSFYQRSATPIRFKDTNCLDGYFPMFPIVNYGMGLGRDRPAFTARALMPPLLVATGDDSPSEVLIEWSAGAPKYQLQRRTASTGWANHGAQLTTSSFVDTDVEPESVYAYRVVALDAGGSSLGTSNVDVATTFAFPPRLTGGETRIEAVHFNHVADAVNELRKVAGLLPQSLHVSAQQPVHASEMNHLRDALDEARDNLEVPALTHLQPAISPGTRILTWDIHELRDGVR